MLCVSGCLGLTVERDLAVWSDGGNGCMGSVCLPAMSRDTCRIRRMRRACRIDPDINSSKQGPAWGV